MRRAHGDEAPSPATAPALLAVGTTPAWQKVLMFRQLRVGAVNRAEWCQDSGGGKAINFGRAVHRCGGNVTIAQLAGGTTGEKLCRELDGNGIPHLTVRVAAPTRTCTTVLSATDGTVTELIEPSGRVAAAELEQLQAGIRAHLPAAHGVALCGTHPPGVPAVFFAGLAAAARPRAIVLLDAVQEVAPALEAGVDVLKVNCDELRRIADGADRDQAAEYCLKHYPLWAVAVTDGARPAALFTRQGAWEFHLPALDDVRNTIGAGDCTAAVFLNRLCALARDGTIARNGTSGNLECQCPTQIAAALREALAAACASCLDPLPAVFDPVTAARLRDSIRVSPLTAAPATCMTPDTD